MALNLPAPNAYDANNPQYWPDGSTAETALRVVASGPVWVAVSTATTGGGGGGASALDVARITALESAIVLKADTTAVSALSATVAAKADTTTVTALQASLNALPTAIVRAVYLFDSLSSLNAVERHAPDSYAMVVSGNGRYKSNGTNAWATTAVDIVDLAGQNNVPIRGNLSVDDAHTYLIPLGAEGMTYEVLSANIAS